jgi:ATP phosphoribosyltransferase regulatory subunit
MNILPPGFYDRLPDVAEKLWHTGVVLVEQFMGCGYALVLPPLLEYEDTLISAIGNNHIRHTMRVSETQSGRLLALRSDITPQIARMATSSLSTAVRPLRLCYVGNVVRAYPEATRFERQFQQIGLERFGADDVGAVLEVIRVAVLSLGALGIQELTLELVLPDVLKAVLEALGLDTPTLKSKLIMKDQSLLQDTDPKYQLPIRALLGLLPLADTLDTLAPLQPPLFRDVKNLSDIFTKTHPHLKLQLELTDARDFSFQHGICFRLLSPTHSLEIGRGGCYYVEGEAACGFSFYTGTLEPMIRMSNTKKTILVSLDTLDTRLTDLQQQGWCIVFADVVNNEQAIKAKAQAYLIQDEIKDI